MRWPIYWVWFGVATLCVACKSTADIEESPAVLMNTTARSSNVLERAVAGELHRDHVLLAPDALTRKSALVIEPVRMRDTNGILMQGYETRMPERFHLVKAGASCILIHDGTGSRMPLDGLKCIVSK